MKKGQLLTLVKDLKYVHKNKTLTIPQGEQIEVIEIDGIHKKVLVSTGEIKNWYGIEILQNLTQHAS
jgi:hypothetical protein